MFFPHHANIIIKKDEPDIDAEAELKIILSKNKSLAERIVAHDLLKKQKTKKDVSKKVQDLVELDLRYDAARTFLATWNHWRNFYFGMLPLGIRNKGQLTCIENILQLCEENEFNVNIFCACVHRAYLHKSTRPPFQWALAYGEDLYEKWFDQVVADIDQDEFEKGLI